MNIRIRETGEAIGRRVIQKRRKLVVVMDEFARGLNLSSRHFEYQQGMAIAQLYSGHGAYPRAAHRHSFTLLDILMDIRFISSLTPEDENTFAPALLKAVGAVLDQLPIAYTVRIETTGAQVFQHTHPSFEAALPVVSRVVLNAIGPD